MAATNIDGTKPVSETARRKKSKMDVKMMKDNYKRKKKEPMDWEETAEGQNWLGQERQSSNRDSKFDS